MLFRMMLTVISVCFVLFSTLPFVQAAEPPVRKAPKIVAIATGAGHSLVLDDQGNMWGWGDSYSGQVGNWTDPEKGWDEEPWHILRPLKAKHRVDGTVSLSAGMNYSAALTTEGNVAMWGNNGNLALGFWSIEDDIIAVPEKVQGITDVKQVVASYGRTTVRKKDGTVWVWGGRVWGEQLSDVGSTEAEHQEFIKKRDEYQEALTAWGEQAKYEYLLQVKGIDEVVSIVDGFAHTLALKEDGTVWSWGQESHGQLGNGTTKHNLLPTKVKGLENVTVIAAGFSLHNLAVKKDGTVWAWGRNTQGRLGLGTNTMENMVPAKVVGLTDVIAISSGYHHVLALKKDGTVWSWGLNESGQIGDGTQTRYGKSPETSDYHDKKVPVKVEFVNR